MGTGGSFGIVILREGGPKLSRIGEVGPGAYPP